jgi:hypothetical protein
MTIVAISINCHDVFQNQNTAECRTRNTFLNCCYALYPLVVLLLANSPVKVTVSIATRAGVLRRWYHQPPPAVNNITHTKKTATAREETSNLAFIVVATIAFLIFLCVAADAFFLRRPHYVVLVPSRFEITACIVAPQLPGF